MIASYSQPLTWRHPWPCAQVKEQLAGLAQQPTWNAPAPANEFGLPSFSAYPGAGFAEHQRESLMRCAQKAPVLDLQPLRQWSERCGRCDKEGRLVWRGGCGAESQLDIIVTNLGLGLWGGGCSVTASHCR